MNILYYCWNENSENDILDTFHTLGHTYLKVSYPIKNYDTSAIFESQLHELLKQYPIDFIFTFNYFPILSKIALAHDIPYAAWVYDCPHLMLYSKTIRNPCNYLFLFDRQMLQQIKDLGAVHAYHLPLAVHTKRLNAQLQLNGQLPSIDYNYPVSFVGSLYEQNMYQQIHYLPEHLRGYLDGIMAAQQQIYGYSLIETVITPAIIQELLSYIQIEYNPNYSFTPKDIIVNMLNKNITSSERITLLNSIAQVITPDIFTASDKQLLKNARIHDFISYTDTMPSVFCQSKINLNISLRSIRSGIPLRCMDIFGAGGFLLSNYQPELCEFFSPNEDFVYFESNDDLLAKIEYYLQHENDRMEIAHNGWSKIQNQFSYEIQVTKLVETIYHG